MKDKDHKRLKLIVKDHAVSGEIFELVHNKNYDFLETKPQPTLDQLPDYYKSDDYISHTDSKRNLFETTYQLIKKISIKNKLKLINTYSKSGKVLLDMGSGTGSFLQIAQQHGWKVSGIEPNQDARKIANKKIGDLVFDVDHLIKLEKEHYDVITLWHVLEHLPNIEEHLKIFNSLLKQNGVLIIAVPNYKSYDAQFYKNHWAAYDVPRHLWHFSKTAISKLVALENMKVIKRHPMLLDAFYVSLLSEKYKTGTMNPLRAFWIGFLSNLKGIQTKEYSSIIYCIKKA